MNGDSSDKNPKAMEANLAVWDKICMFILNLPDSTTILTLMNNLNAMSNRVRSKNRMVDENMDAEESVKLVNSEVKGYLIQMQQRYEQEDIVILAKSAKTQELMNERNKMTKNHELATLLYQLTVLE